MYFCQIPVKMMCGEGILTFLYLKTMPKVNTFEKNAGVRSLMMEFSKTKVAKVFASRG
jgi:hypothetical protein